MSTTKAADLAANVFLQGKKTYLRRYEVADAPQLVRWLNHPDIRQFIKNDVPISVEQEEDWIRSSWKDQSNITLAICTLEGDVFIGGMGLHRINTTHRVASTGAMIGNPSYHSGGYGSDAKMALLEYAFLVRDLHRINSSVFSNNHRSINYSLKCGYKLEGVQRQAIHKGGERLDRVMLGLLKKDWLPVYEQWKKDGTFPVFKKYEIK